MKSRPLVQSSFCEERVCPSLFLPTLNSTAAEPVWLKKLDQSFNQSLLLDRHFLREIETNMCIGSLQEEKPFHSVSSHLLILAQINLNTNIRELPVSLLRLFFAGQQHFSSIVERISFDAFRHLCQLFGIPLLTPERRDESSEQKLQQYLMLLCDYTFCSFERTLRYLTKSIYTHKQIPFQMTFQQIFSSSAYWEGFFLGIPPQGIQEMHKHLILYTIVWRIYVTLLLEDYVKPWHNEETEHWFLYKTKLFRDTHLDLLSIATKDGLYEDEQLHNLLRIYYPTSNRICCVEELPDLSIYATDNYKTGPHLKERTTLPEKISHYSCIKTFNNICKDRNWWDIIRTYGEQHPIIYDHIKLGIKCVLLGNLPGSLGQLSLAARIRINISFFPEYADEDMTREEIDATMLPNSNPYILAEEKRKKKLAKEKAKNLSKDQLASVMKAFDTKEALKMNYTKTRFKMWLIKCRYFASSLMKEILFYTQESDGLMNRFLSLNQKWIQYKLIIRLANGKCRNEISRQISLCQWSINWFVIENIEKSQDNKYDLKKGEIMYFHNKALTVSDKVRKRDFIGIVLIKSTAIEEKIDLDKLPPIEPIYCDTLPQDGSPQQKMTLEELHFITYCMAMEQTPLVKTSLFQAMGMSREGIITLRELMMEYYTYAIPDDSIKKRIRAFLERSIQDYIIMKTAFKMIEYYRKREHVFHLPIQFAHRQIHALRRRQLKIDDHDPTPEKLGVHYQCHGCQNFATTKIFPQDYPSYSNYSELSHSRFRVFSNFVSPNPATGEENASEIQPTNTGLGCEDIVLCFDGKNYRTLEHYKTLIATTTNSSGSARKPRELKEGKEGKKKKKPKKKDNVGDNISFLSIASYNSHDGMPYCERNKRNGISGKFSLKSIDTKKTESVVIMRTRNSKIKVYSHRTISSKVNDEDGDYQEEEEEEREEEDDEDDEEDEDDEDDEDSGKRGKGTRRKKKHSEQSTEDYDPLPYLELMSDNLSELTKENFDRMEQYVKQRTGDFVLPKHKENNKRKILNIILEPLHKLYNCRVPMQEIDMIGLVKNGKTLCVECGMMTEYKNFNMSPYGPVCNTHPLASLMHHHPSWVNHNHLQNGTSMTQLLQQVRTLDDEFLTQGEMSKFANKRKILHPSVLLARNERSISCEICHQSDIAVRLTFQSDSFLLSTIKCCFVCHHNLTRTRPTKPILLTKNDILEYQIQKGYHLTHSL